MREWLARVRDWLHRDALDAELDEELAFHRAQLERDARAAGASPDEARWAARRALGSTLRAKAGARARWSLPALDRALHDVRYAVRGRRVAQHGRRPEEQPVDDAEHGDVRAEPEA